MKRILGVLLLLLVQPAWSADDPPGCAWLCGNWVLDVARSDPAEPVVDTALEKYREIEPRKPRQTSRVDPYGQATELAPDPTPASMSKLQVRAQLLALLTPPATLALGEKDDEVLIRSGDGAERRYFPGEPHSRVDALGTAKIRADWKKDTLIISESYGHRRAQTETFALQPDGTLQVTRVLERPEAKVMRLRAVYRRR